MDDVVSYYGSLSADFWENIPIDLLERCASKALEIIPSLVFLSLKRKISVLHAVLQQVANEENGTLELREQLNQVSCY